MTPSAAPNPTRRPGRTRRAGRTGGPNRPLPATRTLTTTVAATLATAMLAMTTCRPSGAALSTVTAALRRRLTQLLGGGAGRTGRPGRDAGLTTVEVAVITAVLLGLATALVAAITIVVNRNTSRIR